MRAGLLLHALDGGGAVWRGAGVWRAHLDPRDQAGNLRVREFLVFRRHAQFIIRVTHRLDEQAMLRIARRDGWPGVAALAQAFPAI